MTILIGKIIRSRRRTIALIVQRDGSVIIRAPLHAPEGLIREFVESKAEWVRRKQAQAKKYIAAAEKRYVEGEKFLYLGKTYLLAIVDHQRPTLVLDDRFRLAKSALLKAEQAFIRWYKVQAMRVLSERVKWYAEKHVFSYHRIRITSARTRWGSCSSEGVLSFSWRVVMAPLAVVDYVVVHELVHLKIKNHSKFFWANVQAIIPEYKQHVAWLKSKGCFLTLDATK